jgi:hypothetical protein
VDRPATNWTLAAIFTGANGTNQTPFPTNISAGPRQEFFRVHATNEILSINFDPQVLRDAVEPVDPFDNGQFSTFQFFRTGDISNALTFFFTVGGTATTGVDYVQITNSLTFDPFNDFATVQITPLFKSNDMHFSLSVTLTLIESDSYLIDTNNGPSATILIERNRDGDSWMQLVNITNTTNAVHSPIGIGYHSLSNLLVLSVNYPTGTNTTFNFAFNSLDTNGFLTNWSDVSGLTDEIKLAVVPTTNNSNFHMGEMFFGTGHADEIGMLTANPTNASLPWLTLMDTNGVGDGGGLRGSLCFDTNGDFGYDLIAVTDAGGVWRVHSQTNVTLLANFNTLLEGVTTIPNDTNRYGPWAGKILAGAENGPAGGTHSCLFTVSTNGATNVFFLGDVAAEDIHVIPTNQDFYVVVNNASALLKLPKDTLTNYVGDVIITQSGEDSAVGLVIEHWNTNTLQFDKSFVRAPIGLGYEECTFAPVEIPSSTIPAQ